MSFRIETFSLSVGDEGFLLATRLVDNKWCIAHYDSEGNHKNEWCAETKKAAKSSMIE